MLVSKICLTGGPCAGKTTALVKIEQELTEKGYKVLIIDELATNYINRGIKPVGIDNISWYDFETMMLEAQILKEKHYEKAAELIDKPCVIICDRGIFDIKSFIDDKTFNKILRSKKLKRLDLMDSYDLVIHMNTAAKGKEEFYTTSNNKARSEDISLAIERDDECQKSWEYHNNLYIVDNSVDFEEKIQKVVNIIFDELGIKYTKQKKYLIEMTETLEDKLKENNNIVIDLKQVYLKTDKNYEMRLRTRSLDGLDSYFVSIKKDYKRKESIITNQRIDKKEYERLLKQRKIKNIVEKKRICFTYKEHVYKLDIFDNNTYILETDEKVKIPSFIKVIKDVSSDKKYKNRNINVN